MNMTEREKAHRDWAIMRAAFEEVFARIMRPDYKLFEEEPRPTTGNFFKKFDWAVFSAFCEGFMLGAEFGLSKKEESDHAEAQS